MKAGKILLNYIKFKNVHIADLAPILYMNRLTLFLKLHGLLEFKSREINILGELFGRELVYIIFFGNYVDFKSTVDENLKL